MMKRKSKVFGYRSDVTWKKVIATIYYLFALALIFIGTSEIVKEFKFSDYIITSQTIKLVGAALLVPPLFLSNFKMRKKIPILKNKNPFIDGIAFCLLLIVSLTMSVNYSYSVKNVEQDINDNSEEAIQEILNRDHLIVHYIDVDQGDSTFIELPNGETILIDAGEKIEEKVVANYISNLGYKQITYVVGSHPHTDHIGGLRYIVNNFKIKNIYMPNASSDTYTFTKLLQAIEDKGLKVKVAKKGVKIVEDEDLLVEILSPDKESYEELNNSSAVIKITYKKKTFLFMADAEKLIEDQLNEENVDVVRVGHHGSSSSSSKDFVYKTNPTYAIISVGKDNDYKHPHEEVLKRWRKNGSVIYRTDIDGNIKIFTDGNNLSITTNKTKKELTESEEQPKEVLETNNTKPEIEQKKDYEIKIIDITKKVKRGKEATVKIQGKPNTKYDINVYYSLGVSNAKGLEDKKSDEDGIVSWTWKVGDSTIRDDYKIEIKDSNKSIETTFTVE